MALTEGQSLTITETMTFAVTVKLTETLLLINTNKFPMDKALFSIE